MLGDGYRRSWDDGRAQCSVLSAQRPRWRGNSSNTRVGGATRVSCHACERAPSHSRYRALTGARSHAPKAIKFQLLCDGTLKTRKHRDGGKGDRKAQAKRQAEKLRLARLAARVAACLPPNGKAERVAGPVSPPGGGMRWTFGQLSDVQIRLSGSLSK